MSVMASMETLSGAELPNVLASVGEDEDAHVKQRYLDASILIVDDRSLQCDLITAYLTKAGYTNISQAANGIEALDMMRSVSPDLVLLDIMMPDMDGYEVCRRIRADPFTHDIPVLFQSAVNKVEERSRAFEVGATDMVSKPIYGPELIARVRIQLENRFLIRELSVYQERLRYELNMAHGMQKALMPNLDDLAKLSDRYNMGIAAHYEACEELGGDFWSIRPVSDDGIGFVLVDFSGHGVTAALNTFRLHTMLDWMTVRAVDDTGSFLEVVNKFFRRVLPTGQYATMIVGHIDTKNEVLRYASAAHPPPILGSSSTGKAEFLESAGLPIGIKRTATYEERRVPFTKDSVLFLYSDALIETPDPAHPVIDRDDLLQLVREQLGKNTADDLVENVLNRFFHMAPGPLSDDLSVLCVSNFGSSGALHREAADV